MITNPGRWLLFTLALVVACSALVGFKGLSLGPDLKGGTRLVYSVPIEQAMHDGTMPPSDSRADVLRKTIDIMLKRVDGLGLREISIVGQGEDEIVVELPGLSEVEIGNIKDTITSLGRLEWRIVAGGSDPFVMDQEQKKLEAYFARADVAKKIQDWEALQPERRDLRFWVDLLRVFNFSEGPEAPARGLRWYPATLEKNDKSPNYNNPRAPHRPDFHAVRIEEQIDSNGQRFVFRGEDLDDIHVSRDQRGGLAVGFRFKPEKRTDFGDFTEKYQGRLLAVILNDVIDTEATIEDRLPGEGIISSNKPGGYTPEELKALMTVFETGSLQVKPRLESESRVGASLGEDSIRLGTLSGVLALIATFAFMLLYYRVAGIVAAISLVVNAAILLGVLSIYGATLTMPGIGGFILTLAMAVDSNILIYERIREERDRGRGVDQAVRLGFDRALVTIIDSNLTTLITSVVLLMIGTGPIKGLGLTLSVGILTTLFAALVFTKASFAWLLERRLLPEVKMLRLFKKTPDWRFIRVWKVTLAISVLTTVAGLAAFLSAPENVYGIDFVGGATARVRLAEPQPPAVVAAKLNDAAVVKSFESLSVIPSLSEGSAAGSAGYREFVVKGKLNRERREELKADTTGKGQEILNNFRREIRQALAGSVLPDGVADLTIEKAASGPAGGAVPASFTLNFVEPVPAARVQERLSTTASIVTNVQVAEAAGNARAHRVTGVAPATVDPTEFVTRVSQALASAGADGSAMPRLTEPFPEINTIQPKVAKSLKNKAILSLLVSFGLIVLYVRFRFAEYRYGLGGVIGIIHDLVVTLGIVAIANQLNLVDVEIDMVMIATFLTIAGYSINDTIVIYDRIRENLAKPEEQRKPLAEVVDESCNQTLARTLLTATAAFLASFLMFVINRGRHNPLEGFGFTMMVGIASGTYSSIWVASLFVVGVENMRRRRGGRAGGAAPVGKNVGTVASARA